MSQRSYDPATSGTELLLAFAQVDRVFTVEAILDLDSEGAIVGIEVLGVLDEPPNLTSPGADALALAGVVSVAIDTDADAMYVKLQSGVTSDRQEVRRGLLGADANDVLAEVRILPD
jgi:uncharacterized protein YuzE